MKNNTRKILLALLVVMTLLVSMATVTAFAEEPTTDDDVTIYFENNWLWTDVCVYYWDATNTPNAEWPGQAMTLVGTLNNHEVYSISVPAGVAGLIINGIKDDGSGNRDQTPDITSGIVDGAAWRMLWVDGNQVESFTYDPDAPVDPNPTPNPNPTPDGAIYTVAGVAGLCYSEWNVTDTYNDMTLNAETGLYEKTFKGIPAGTYECKVAANHSWDQSWGGDSGEFGNYGFTTFEEHDITITFDPVEQKVGHYTSESTGADDNRPTPEAPDIDTSKTVTIYLGNSANWETPFFYCWTLGSSDQNAAWPGVEMEWDSEKLLYYAEVPEYYVNIIFNDGNGTQTADLVIPGDGALFDNVTNEWGDIGNYTPPAAPENTTSDVTVYIKDDAGWGDVYIYYWDADGAEAFSWPGTPMDYENGYYTAVIPAGYWSVIFNNGGSWEDGSLQQTPDLIIPTDGKVYLSNGNDCLYNEGSADDNNAWYAAGGNTDKPSGDQPGGDQPGGDEPGGDEPAKEMTLIQKLAKALLLFLRRMEDIFKGFFKK